MSEDENNYNEKSSNTEESSSNLAELEQATLKIQKWFRGEKIRKQIRIIHSAALKIQTFYRSKKCSHSFSKFLSSIIRIQSSIRSYQIRSKLIKSRLDDFLTKETAYLKNLSTLEHAELFSSSETPIELPIQEALKTLSTITENSASLTQSQLISTGSLAIYSRQVSPFHLEKMYFFVRPLEFEILLDDSIVYSPLWGSQFEVLNKELYVKEELIMDIALGNCHTLAITNRGRVFAWGWNDKYQCGSSGAKPRLVESLKDCKIVQISCGDDHSLLLDTNGLVFGLGDNSKGQLGQGTYSEVKNVVQIDVPSCKQVVASGNLNMAVSAAGDLYLWPFETIHGEKRSYPMKLLHDYTVSEVSVGYNFAMILTSSGLLFSLGSDNRSGQLGHGDTSPRSSPTLVLALKKLGEKISKVSCGKRHVAAKSTLGKIFVWGYGADGQLGNSSFQNELAPKQIVIKNERLKPVQISSGCSLTIVMVENRRVYYSGTCSSMKSNVFTEVNVANKFPEFFKNPGEFAIVKIESVLSRTISTAIATFVDLRYMQSFQNSGNKLQGAVNTIASKWISKTIEPPFIENISGYYPSNLCKKSNAKPVTAKIAKPAKHPFDDIKEKISEILKKPNEKWTVEDKYMMEHISKINH